MANKSNKETTSIVLALITNVLLFASAVYCIITLYNKGGDSELGQFPFASWLMMCANSFISCIELVKPGTFNQLHKFLDYSALVLAVPFITADFWLNVMAQPLMAYIHATIALIALFSYVVLEYRREDLTDFAVFTNMVSLIIAAILKEKYLNIATACLGGAAYLLFKRGEWMCKPPNDQEKYNITMTLFNISTIKVFMDME